MNDEETRRMIDECLRNVSAMIDVIPEEVWNKPATASNVTNMAAARISRGGLFPSNWSSDLAERLERIIDADEEELNRIEAELKPETRAIFGLAANDGTKEPTDHR